MNSQTLAGGLAAVIGAVVVAYVVFVGARNGGPVEARPKTTASPAAVLPVPAPVQQPAGKGPVVRDLPIE